MLKNIIEIYTIKREIDVSRS